jgi:hypothetical protein
MLLTRKQQNAAKQFYGFLLTLSPEDFAAVAPILGGIVGAYLPLEVKPQENDNVATNE